MKIVYIHYQDGIPLTDNTYIAEYGFKRMGYNTIPFTSDDVVLGRFGKSDKSAIFVGGINSLRNVMKYMEVKEPEIDNPNVHLPDYCGSRNFTYNRLGQIRELFLQKLSAPLFIKPEVDDKLFTGFVVNGTQDLIKLTRLSDDVKLIVSDVINIRSEYRCFVLDKHLQGVRHYTGDFTVLPDFDVINNAIEDYKDQPRAYSIDFALTDEDETVLIEINDAFGLSSYGLNPIKYCKMLEARWEEIMKNTN